MLWLAGFSVIICANLLAVDGDTVKCDGRNMRLLGNGAPFVDGIDAPEIGRAKCKRERELGRKAQQRLAELIGQPGVRIEDSGAIDSFDRPLVRVRLPDGRLAEQLLLEDGVAVIWKPGEAHDWCRP